MDRKQYFKEYREKNKEKIIQQQQEYRQTGKYKKTQRIAKWKRRGIIFHDYNLLYEIYLQTTNCDNCKCLLTYDRYTTETTKCVDHDHTITDDENVRNILCNSCNIKRG